jgi:hypothetical protein
MGSARPVLRAGAREGHWPFPIEALIVFEFTNVYFTGVIFYRHKDIQQSFFKG